MKQIFEWVPVDERLPEVNADGCSEYILISFENWELPAVGRYEEDKDGGGKFFEGDEETSCAIYGFFVNAWAPMIKPYREEDE